MTLLSTDKTDLFFAERRPATPCIVLDLDRVEANYRELEAALPGSAIFYAVKANPAPEILQLLVRLGASFDTASVAEIRMVLAAGADPSRISYGNTIKKERDIATAVALGIGLFAFDSVAELEKLGRAAPGARVFCRILTSGEGAEWPLSRKFGCEPQMAHDLLLQSRALGLTPFGVSFHVGSQQRHPEQWDAALATAAGLFRSLEAEGVELRMVNLGGGFPTAYREQVPETATYGQVIGQALRRHFGNRIPETIVEPGRSLVGSAGRLFSEVVLVSRKSDHDARRWVYLDAGKFNGLAETMDEAIKYRITTDRTGPEEAVVLAGPTCDSADVLYERTEYKLPLSLTVGDLVRVHGAGAYTTTYASVAFNGFEPLSQYCI